MKDLNEKREFNKIIEKAQAKLFYDYTKKNRDYFEFAHIQQSISYEKNVEDTLILSNTISEWILKLKPDDKRKKELEDLLQSVWRVMAYCQNIETVIKECVSRYIVSEKRNTELASENLTLRLKLEQLEKSSKKEIDDLKKEIEFINKP